MIEDNLKKHDFPQVPTIAESANEYLVGTWRFKKANPVGRCFAAFIALHEAATGLIDGLDDERHIIGRTHSTVIALRQVLQGTDAPSAKPTLINLISDPGLQQLDVGELKQLFIAVQWLLDHHTEEE